jgi:dTDP-4-dehydrorhamnose reductase
MPVGGTGTAADRADADGDVGSGGPPTVLVTGGAGLLGRALLASAPPGATVHATWRRTPLVVDVPAHRIDLGDADATAALLERLQPDVVLHTAYGKDDGRRDVIEASANVAAACAAVGADLVHLSSDMVFDGEHAPYAEDAPPSPVTEYGRWKAAAEDRVREHVADAAVVRTSLIVSIDPLDHASHWMAEALRGGNEITLFVDELRCPIAAEDLAGLLWDLVDLPARERAGVWHLAGPEVVSRYSLGLLVAHRLGLPPAFAAGRNRDLAEPRPRDLRLSTARADAALPRRPRSISEALA